MSPLQGAGLSFIRITRTFAVKFLHQDDRRTDRHELTLERERKGAIGAAGRLATVQK